MIASPHSAQVPPPSIDPVQLDVEPGLIIAQLFDCCYNKKEKICMNKNCMVYKSIREIKCLPKKIKVATYLFAELQRYFS